MDFEHKKGWKTDMVEPTKISIDAATLVKKVQFNVIDRRVKVQRRLAFRVDDDEIKFIEEFKKKYGFTDSMIGRFAIDLLRALEKSGLLVLLVEEYRKLGGSK